jgi:hypothetical protein
MGHSNSGAEKGATARWPGRADRPGGGRLAQIRDLPRVKCIPARRNLQFQYTLKSDSFGWILRLAIEVDHHSPADSTGRIGITRWGVVLLSAQIAAEG